MMIVFKVESITNQIANLRDQNNNLISWPQDKLPAGVTVGTEIFFHIHPQKDLINHEKKLAENILNEILNTQS